MLEYHLPGRCVEDQVHELRHRHRVADRLHWPFRRDEVLQEQQQPARTGHPPHLGEQGTLGRWGIAVHGRYAEDQIEALALVGEEQIRAQKVDTLVWEAGAGGCEQVFSSVDPDEPRRRSQWKRPEPW